MNTNTWENQDQVPFLFSLEKRMNKLPQSSAHQRHLKNPQEIHVYVPSLDEKNGGKEKRERPPEFQEMSS